MRTKTLSLYLIALSTGAHASAIVELSHDAEIVDLRTKEKKTLKVGETTTVGEGAAYQVLAADRMPVFLVSAESREKLSLSAPTLNESVRNRQKAEIGRMVGHLMTRIADIQSLLQRKRVEEAQAELTRIRQDYGPLPFLDFIQASLFYLRGQRDDALRTAEKALQEYPDYGEGKRFVEQLKKGRNP